MIPTGGYFFLRLPTLMTTKAIVAASVLLLLLVMVVGPLPTARADTTFTVKSSADTDGTTCGASDCTLRQAINAANAASGNDTILFDVGQTAKIPLDSQLPTITDASGLTIDGGSASITVSGEDKTRVFYVDGGAKSTLARLTVADGRASYGGGIFNYGTLDVNNSTFSGNIAPDSYGGAIDNIGNLTVTNSTFSGNSSLRGGGAIGNDGSMEVTSSTFSGHSAGNSAYGCDGVICNFWVATLKNTILANNSGGNCAEMNAPSIKIADGGYNIDDGTTCGFSTTNNSQPSTNPLLDPAGLKDNGGPTKTVALLEGSPAIDKGNSFGLTTDQRGLWRPQDDPAIPSAPGGDGSDIGALEVEAAPTLKSIDDGDADDQVAADAALSYTLTFSEDIDDSTLTAADLDNAGTASVSIGTITESSTTPGLFTVEVTPTSLGTLVLRIKEGAQVEDIAGNKLEVPVEDDTTLAVINSPPEATRDTYTIADGERSLTVPLPGVLANDTDAQEGDTLTVSLVRGPVVGTLKLKEDGSFVYRMPKRTYLRNEFSGVAFVYEVSDGNGGTDRAKVTINKG